jgi:hypothetical protein
MFVKSTNNSTSFSKCLKFTFIVCLILVGCQFIFRTSLLSRIHNDYNNDISSSYIFSLHQSQLSNNTVSPGRTLVVYVYAKSHDFAEQNLVFFIRTAVRQYHDADYYFILQQINNVPFDKNKLPLLPSNAHYVQHENKCFDTGAVGWLLSSGMVNTTKYKYFIFLNSSVRGPFIVSYYDNPMWYTIFTRRLNDHVKLVGCTISCQDIAHVQSYLWALDFDGLNLLLNKSTIFACHGTKWDAIYNAEISATQIILKSGFGIDSLMLKYRGVDFRFDRTKKCVDTLNPTYNNAANGMTLDPLEVVFVKMKNDEAQDFDNRKRVGIYEKWIHRHKR